MDGSCDSDTELFEKSFDEYICDSDDEIIVFENEQKSKCTNPTTLMVNDVLLDRAKNNNSYSASCMQMKRLNSVPGAQLKYPISKNQLKREANLDYHFEYYIFCERCNRMTIMDDPCSGCGKKTKKKKNNYFVHIPITQQIQHILDKYLDVIVTYANEERISDELNDIQDSNLYKNLAQKSEGKILMPLTINLDGAQIFRSSKSTLWPIQVSLGFLPPNIRFLVENILVVGLYCGDKKPAMHTIIAPFANDMRILKQKGIFTFHKKNLLHFEPTIMFCGSDLPARAEIQNCKGSGYFGCPCCKQEGESVKNLNTGRSYVRFLKLKQDAPLRTHTDAIEFGWDILKRAHINEANGLKGVSCMIAFKDFDLAAGFALDYMHGVLIGIVTLMVDIWMGKKKLHYQKEEKYRFKKLNPSQRLELNRRIISLKPTMKIGHKPRSILDRSYFTANEYRSLLLYYLRFSMNGLFDKEIIKHFSLLSDAIYILLQTKIKHSEVLKAGKMLKEFADLFENYYGKNAVTINLHLLRHYVDSVLNSGPLWSHCMFPFENNIGVLKRSFKCNVDVVEQIARNYSMKAAAQDISISHHEKEPNILRLKPRYLSTEYEQVILDSNISFQPGHRYQIGYEMRWKNQVFKSTSSTITKSIDYFVQTMDGKIGAIEIFLQLSKPYVLIRIYDVIKTYNHLKQVRPSQTEKYRVYACDEIRRKVMYLKFTYSKVSCIEIITVEPNPFEGN